MNDQTSCNCIVCAQEFDVADLQSIISSQINITKFKICQSCIDISDPADDYNQAKKIVQSYFQYTEIKQLFKEAKDIINDLC
jgi:hypothetical protein